MQRDIPLKRVFNKILTDFGVNGLLNNSTIEDINNSTNEQSSEAKSRHGVINKQAKRSHDMA